MPSCKPKYVIDGGAPFPVVNVTWHICMVTDTDGWLICDPHSPLYFGAGNTAEESTICLPILSLSFE